MPANKRYLIRAADVPAYSPANHIGTVNRRLISPETVGVQGIEMVLGVMLVVTPALPAKSVQELIAHAKANPGTLTYAYGDSTGIVAGVGFDAFSSTPEELAVFVQSELVKWTRLVKEAGIEPE